MDTLRLRAAAGDAARSAQSVLRSAAANPERLAAELQDYMPFATCNLWGKNRTPERLRQEAREHVLLAVACMDAARQIEAAKGGAT